MLDSRALPTTSLDSRTIPGALLVASTLIIATSRWGLPAWANVGSKAGNGYGRQSGRGGIFQRLRGGLSGRARVGLYIRGAVANRLRPLLLSSPVRIKEAVGCQDSGGCASDVPSDSVRPQAGISFVVSVAPLSGTPHGSACTSHAFRTDRSWSESIERAYARGRIYRDAARARS